MKKIILFFSYTIILLTLLSVFGWMSIHRMKKDKDYGILNKPVEYLSKFPDLFEQTVEEVKSLPLTFIPSHEQLQLTNTLNESLKILVTYSNQENGRTIELKDMMDSTVYHQWTLDKTAFDLKDHHRIKNPYMLEDSSICFGIIGANGFFRLDRNSELIWENRDFEAHHSLEMDADGHLWTGAYKRIDGQWTMCENAYSIDWAKVPFLDNYIAQIDPESGKTLLMKSITEILVDHDLMYLILQSAESEDPIHLNDVEPVLLSTPYMTKGDLFLSFRNLGCIIQYRPKTEEVIRVIKGPFSCAHDIDIYDEHTIAMFNNNTQIKMGQHTRNYADAKDQRHLGTYYSQVLFYDLETSLFEPYRDHLMSEHEIFTFTEGLQHFINDSTVFIEEQNAGILWLFTGDELTFKHVLPSHHEGYHHLPNWTRVMN